MAPPIPAHQKRFTANPVRPGRYRPGKGIQEDESSEEESEEEEQQQQIKQPQRKPQSKSKPQAAPTAEEDDDDEEGFVTEEEDEADGGAPVITAIQKTVVQGARTTQPEPQGIARSTPIPPQQEAPESEEEPEEDASDSGSEEGSSSSEEEEVPQRKFQRPTFIRKTARQSSTTQAENTTPTPEVSTTHHDEQVAARRLAEAEQLIKHTIERDVAARLAGKKSWDDDDDLPAEALVDDTDGVDAKAEHSAWRLRELHRLKRDRETLVARERELEEIERRRNLSKSEREAEDAAFLAAQREERESGRGTSGYLSKYHHKGAFFMDDETSERLAKRDLAGARFEGDVDKSVLPEYMRVRDMTKLGRKGGTKYTDLRGTDTGRFGEDVKRWRGSGYGNDGGGRGGTGQGMDLRGMDERFLPDSDRGKGGPEVSGANAGPLGERRGRKRSRSRDGGRDKDTYRLRSRSRSRSRRGRRRSYSDSRSRSRSPRGSRSPPRRRRRTPSPYHDRDKRRRIEA